MYKFDVKIYGTHKRDDQILKNKQILELADNDIFYVQEGDGRMPYPLTKRAFLAPWDSETTHRVVLQDDAELAPNFSFYLQKIIEARPDDIIFLVALDYNDHETEYSKNLKSPYIKLKSMVQGCAIVMPTKYIVDCFDWLDKCFPDIAYGDPHEDTAIIFYGRSKGINVINTIPSIVQHIGDTSSLYGVNCPSRTIYFKDWEKGNWENSLLNEAEKSNKQFITYPPGMLHPEGKD